MIGMVVEGASTPTTTTPIVPSSSSNIATTPRDILVEKKRNLAEVKDSITQLQVLGSYVGSFATPNEDLKSSYGKSNRNEVDELIQVAGVLQLEIDALTLACDAFLGPNCDIEKISCNGKYSIDAGVCNGNGKCVATETCSCNFGFDGKYCEKKLILCGGIESTDPKVCSGNGVCASQDQCACSTGYSGANCETVDPDYVFVSYDMSISSLAPNYASHPISWADMGSGNNWVFTFYLFGKNSDGLNGRMKVYGLNGNALTDNSAVLQTNKNYHIEWTYSKATGSIFSIDGVKVGVTKPYLGKFDFNKSKNIVLGNNIYNGGGRQHSDFSGTISHITIIANGKIQKFNF